MMEPDMNELGDVDAPAIDAPPMAGSMTDAEKLAAILRRVSALEEQMGLGRGARPSLSQPTAEDIAAFVDVFAKLARFEAEQRFIRGIGAVATKDVPIPAVRRVFDWLKEIAAHA